MACLTCQIMSTQRTRLSLLFLLRHRLAGGNLRRILLAIERVRFFFLVILKWTFHSDFFPLAALAMWAGQIPHPAFPCYIIPDIHTLHSKNVLSWICKWNPFCCVFRWGGWRSVKISRSASGKKTNGEEASAETGC